MDRIGHLTHRRRLPVVLTTYLPSSPVVFDPPSRSRGRVIGRLIWPVLLAVVVILAIVVSAAGDDTRAEFEYLDELQAQSVELAKAGDAFRDVVSRLQRIERTEFVTVIDGISRDIAAGFEFVERDPPSEQFVAVQSLYRQALLAWDVGVSGYEASVLLAADEPQNLVVVDAMAESLAELRAGDGIYVDLVTEVNRDELPQPPSPMVDVMLLPADASLVGLSVSYVDSARSPNSGLALRPGLAVSQIVADPDWQVDPSDQAVIPATESVVFSVVITNAGNVVSAEDNLVLTLTGGPEPVRLQVELDTLEPDQQTTVIMEPVPVEPGGVYEVVAALAISENDSNFEDNSITVVFMVNAQ